MKKNYQMRNYLKPVVTLIVLGIIMPVFGQLSGTYTIDNSVTTGGTNYASWADFQTAINTNGVNGAVIVNVLTNQTGSQIRFDSLIGTSSTNTITINGNGKFLEASVADAVILMNGADYFIFDKLIIRNTMNSTNAQGIRFMNNADHNTIKNSTIEFSALTVTSTSGGAYISFSNSATSRTSTNATNHGAYNTFDSNLMRTTNSNSPGPTFGIAIQGSSSTYSSVEQNNTISNNTIQNFYHYAIRNYYSNGNQVLNNDISRANATSNNCNSTLYGIYSYYAYAKSRPALIDGNKLHDWPYSGSSVSLAPTTVYAFYTNYCYGNSTYRFSVSDNKITNLNAKTNMYLGYNFYNYYFDLVNNFADNNDVTVSTSSSYNFHGWYNGYTYNSYRFNGNTIQNCDGGYYWYGIRNYYPQSANDVQEINDNLIQDNKNSYYYSYRIYSYYANYASKTYPIDIVGNIIKNNSSDYYYTYNIYTYYYGTYNITDNVIDNNTSDYYYMYDIYNYYYGNYNVRRNKITGNRNTSGSTGYHYGIYNYYNYDVNITDNLICDNIGRNYTYGIYAYSFQNGFYGANIRQNTVKIDGTKSSYSSHYSYGIYCYMYYHPVVRVYGNIIDISGNYGAYPVYTTGSNPSYIDWDRNLYFINNVSVQNWYSPSGTANSFTNWDAFSFSGSNEKYGDPKWNDASTYDLRSNALLSQNNMPFNSLNSLDANGVPRNTSKNDKGALENMLDIEQTGNDFSPNPFECTGFTTSPTITLKNNFLDAITGFEMGVTVNGVLVSTKTVTANIQVSNSGTVTLNPILFSKAGTQVVKFFLLDADDKPSNDTMTYTFFVKKSPGGGVLTLDSSKSAAKAHFDITGKPDITTNGQAIVYNLSPPSHVGYTNSDHLFNGGTKWVATVNAVTPSGVTAPGASINPPLGSTNAYVTFTSTIGFVDSVVNLHIKITDFVSGCDTTYIRKVFVAPQGVPDFKIPALLCDQDEGFFENTSTVSSGNLLSTWDFGDGSPTSDATNPVYTYSGPGTYTIKLTVVTVPYGYATTISKTINVNEIPNADFKITNACEGVAVKLTNTTTISSGALSYVWNLGDGSPQVNTVNASKIYTAAGGYKVTLFATGNGCTQAISKNVYEFARPLASFAKTKGACENESFEFDNMSSISNGHVGSNWDFDDGGNKATVSEPVYDFVTPGLKNVKLRVISEFGCVDSLTLPITVKAAPTAGFTAPFACSRTSTQFVNTSDLKGEVLGNYAWSFGDGSTSSATAPSHPWSTIGPKVVKLKTTLVNGCSDEISETLNVGVQPEVDFKFADQCSGSEVRFTNLTNFSQGDITYEWNFGDNTSSMIGSPGHIYNIGSGTQTFNVKLKASILGGCADSASKTININPLPGTCNFDMVRDYSASLTGYRLTPTGGPLDGIHYTWLTGDGNLIQSDAAGTYYGYKVKGKYCVTMTAANVAGCECSSTKCITLTTGIDNAEDLDKAISVYPNPNNGQLHVVFDSEFNKDMLISIYDALGALVKTVMIEGNDAEIDLSGFSNGVYVIKVTVDKQVAVKKIILHK